ncbi:transposable element Tcb2 transposase [Trichonephila clavipes]|nr:transposable element Tcb2 transposase [Trichonephila clavipes]
MESRSQNEFQTSGTVSSKVNQGHHRASASARDHYLALRARRHRWTTAHQLARDLDAVSGRRISRQTLYSRLAETVLYAWRPGLCVSLTISNRKDRIVWSRKHQSWTLQEWGYVFFSDE